MGDLIQKLRDSTSGSRELDALIFDQVKQCQYGYKSFKIDNRIDPRLKDRWDDGWRIGDDPDSKWPDLLPAYTTSLDAIIGLIEEKLPGWKWSINQLDYGCNCFVKPPLKTMGDIELQGLGEGGAHSSAPIALCLALLSALEGES